MKAVLMSIQPKWCELIASGKKTVEVRKTKPKLDVPFKVYIYCTQEKRLLHKFDKGERIDDEHFFEEHVFVRQNTWIRGHFNPNGKVIGEFVCDRIFPIAMPGYEMVDVVDCQMSCLSAKEMLEYANGKPLYGWHISNLVIYDKPKELQEFKRICTDFYDGKHCDECKYFIDGRGYEYDESDCGCDGLKPIERPPQSWCYVLVPCGRGELNG